MKKRTAGKNGIVVCEVGLGCWQFCGDFGPLAEEIALEIMPAAVNLGVDFFDTAGLHIELGNFYREFVHQHIRGLY